MKAWLRKLRGVVSIGAIWGLAWSVVGFAIGAIVSVNWPEEMVSVVTVTLRYGVWGFVFGSGFAGVLTIMDGRKTFEELTPKRVAAWGVLTGVVVSTAIGLVSLGRGDPIPLATFVFQTFMCGALTAGLAAATLSLARRAPAELGAGTELDESKLLGDLGES